MEAICSPVRNRDSTRNEHRTSDHHRIPRDRRVLRGELRSVPEGTRRAGLAARPAALGLRGVLGPAHAVAPRRGVAADRHPGAQARRFAAPSASDLAPADRAAMGPAWETLSGHYGVGLEHVNATPTRAADSGKLGGAILVDLATAAKDHPEILKRYLLTDAVSPTADSFSALHAAFWTGGTLLYVPKGVKVDVPLFSLVGMAGSGSVDLDHTLVVVEDGAEATLVRECSSVARARRLGLARRGRGVVRGQGGQPPVRQPPELGRRDLAFQPGAGPGRRRCVDPVDRRRPRRPARQGEPGGRLDGAGGRRPGQRGDVHHRQAAPGLLHQAGPHGPQHPERPALQGGPEGSLADRLEGDDQGREGRPEDRRLPEGRQPRSSPRTPGPTRSPAWRSRPTTSAAPTAPPPGGSTRR